MSRSVVAKAAAIIRRTHAESLHLFYQRAAEALDQAGLLVTQPTLQPDTEDEDGVS